MGLNPAVKQDSGSKPNLDKSEMRPSRVIRCATVCIHPRYSSFRKWKATEMLFVVMHTNFPFTSSRWVPTHFVILRDGLGTLDPVEAESVFSEYWYQAPNFGASRRLWNCFPNSPSYGKATAIPDNVNPIRYASAAWDWDSRKHVRAQKQRKSIPSQGMASIMAAKPYTWQSSSTGCVSHSAKNVQGRIVQFQWRLPVKRLSP